MAIEDSQSGTRVVGSGRNEDTMPSPFPVVHVTDNPQGGVTMAQRRGSGNEERPEDVALTDGRTEAEAQLDAVTAEEAAAEQPDSLEGDELKAELDAELEAEDVVAEEDLAAEDETSEEEDEQPPSKRKRPYVFTPFQATKFLNRMLEEAGVKNADNTGPKEVGSPMLYIYARAKRFQIRRSPIDKELQEKDPNYMKGQKPRWEVYPLTSFNEWATEYVENQKKGITAAQSRKKNQEAAATASDDTAEQDVAEALKASLEKIREGNDDEEEELASVGTEVE